MSILLTWLLNTKIGRTVSVCIALAFGAAFFYALAYTQGRTSILQKQVERSLEAWEARSKIDDNVENLDRFDLCVELGGLPIDCAEQLRGMEETPKTE